MPAIRRSERLRRSFQPADLLPELQAAGVHYTIAVEAADDPPRMLATARHHDWIARVIGWSHRMRLPRARRPARPTPPGDEICGALACAAARATSQSWPWCRCVSAGNATDESTAVSSMDADP